MSLKFGMPADLTEYTIDSWHTMYYAAGYLFKQVKPRIACYQSTTRPGIGATTAESIAEIRSHWDGLFMWGGPDVQVLNVTKDAIWAREAAVPEGAAIAAIDPRMLVRPGCRCRTRSSCPVPRCPREEQQEQFLRDMEIDPHEYYPADVDREPVNVWPEEGFTIEPRKMLKARGIDPDADVGTDAYAVPAMSADTV